MSNGSIKKRNPHDYNVVCDICGRKRKMSECTMAYGNGIIPIVVSCTDGCADKLQPLNYPPPVIFDGRPVPNARPDQAINKETFLTITLPAFFSWGSFPGGNWGNFNPDNNNEFNYTGIWLWGGFGSITWSVN